MVPNPASKTGYFVTYTPRKVYGPPPPPTPPLQPEPKVTNGFSCNHHSSQETHDSGSECKELHACSDCHKLDYFFGVYFPVYHEPTCCEDHSFMGQYYLYEPKESSKVGHRTRSMDQKASKIRMLIEEDRRIEAVNCTFEFGLVEEFHAVHILMDHLYYSLFEAKSSCGKKNHSMAGKIGALVKVISAFKAVLKSVRQHELDGEFPPSSIAECIAQLEEMKADVRRGGKDGKD